MEGHPSGVVWGLLKSVVRERFQRWRQMGIFEKLMKWMAEYYARERWDLLEVASDGFQELSSSSGG